MSNPAFELIRTVAEILRTTPLGTDTVISQVGEPFLAADSAKVHVGVSNADVGLLTVELSAIQVTSDLTETPEAALQRTAGALVGLRHAIVQFAPERFRPSYAQIANFDEYPLSYVRELEQTIAHLREDLAKLAG